MIVNAGKPSEVTVLVFLESNEFGRVYFDYVNLDKTLAGIRRLVKSALKSSTSIERVVGLAIIPVDCYGSDDGCYDLESDDQI